jgi:hypothetical protein
MDVVTLSWIMLFVIPGVSLLVGLAVGRWWVLPLPIGLWWLYWVGTDQGWWGISPADGWLGPLILRSPIGMVATGFGVLLRRKAGGCDQADREKGAHLEGRSGVRPTTWSAEEARAFFGQVRDDRPNGHWVRIPSPARRANLPW